MRMKDTRDVEICYKLRQRPRERPRNLISPFAQLRGNGCMPSAL